MDQLSESGFAHSMQSLRIVERLEKDGEGLNLTWEVRQGIVCHSKPRGDFLEQDLAESLTLEGQILRVADSVAYLNHDIADAIRAGILHVEDLPKEVNDALGTTHSQRIDTLVTDIVFTSWDASGETYGQASPATDNPPTITMSHDVRHAANLLREFMFQEVYLPLGETEESEVAREIIRVLFQHFVEHPRAYTTGLLPARGGNENQAAVDYLSRHDRPLRHPPSRSAAARYQPRRLCARAPDLAGAAGEFGITPWANWDSWSLKTSRGMPITAPTLIRSMPGYFLFHPLEMLYQ